MPWSSLDGVLEPFRRAQRAEVSASLRALKAGGRGQNTGGTRRGGHNSNDEGGDDDIAGMMGDYSIFIIICISICLLCAATFIYAYYRTLRKRGLGARVVGHGIRQKRTRNMMESMDEESDDEDVPQSESADPDKSTALYDSEIAGVSGADQLRRASMPCGSPRPPTSEADQFRRASMPCGSPRPPTSAPSPRVPSPRPSPREVQPEVGDDASREFEKLQKLRASNPPYQQKFRPVLQSAEGDPDHLAARGDLEFQKLQRLRGSSTRSVPLDTASKQVTREKHVQPGIPISLE